MQPIKKSKEEIKALVELNKGKKSKELNELYPEVSTMCFSAYFAWQTREKNGTVKHNTNKVNKVVETEIKFVGGNKKNAREIMTDWAEKSGVVGRCFSFTQRTAELEKVILKRIPEMTFLSVDNNLNVIKEMRRTKRQFDLPLDIHYGEAINILHSVAPNELAHAFLDFCCHVYTATNEIKTVMENDLVKVNGTIAITFSKSVRNRAKNQYGDLWKTFYDVISNQDLDDRCLSDKANILYLASLLNQRYTIRQILNYSGGDDDKGAPMTLAILQRIR